MFRAEEFKPDYTLEEVNVVSSKKKFEPSDLQTKSEKKTKPSIEEPPKLELKPLPIHLKYAYLRENDTLPIIISTHLKDVKNKVLLHTLKRHMKAIGWTLTDIQGISPSYCMYKIMLEEAHTGTI